ncbi:hydrolase [Aureococcus anophagefferens]|nr:hydrolase [Aureococcus anophagefferens]
MAATRAATLVGGDGIAGGDVCLVIIDPQNDFHDGGSLAVPGADDDTKRTAAFLEKHADRIDTVLVTLDSHQTRHIANPSFWEKPDDAAARLLPFTVIGSKALADGAWRGTSSRLGGRMNNKTEMYSCFKAEVELDDDATTKLNAPLIASLAAHKAVVCCGQAKSHCVN